MVQKSTLIRLHVTAAEERGMWNFAPAGNVSGQEDRAIAIAGDKGGGLYAGISTGTITRYQSNVDGTLVIDRDYRLELKCSGACIEGVRPREQYEILRLAVER